MTPKSKEHFSAERLADLVTFVNRIMRIPYLKPDGAPKKEWRVFYASTWGEAWHLAKTALEEEDFAMVDQGRPSIENISLLAANQEAKTFSFVSPEFFDNTAWCACHVAQEAVKAVTTSWEWNKKRFDVSDEEDVKVDPNTPRHEGAIKAEVAEALIGLLRQMNKDIIGIIGNPTARESAIESAGEDAWCMARLILAEKHPYFHRERHVAHVNARIEVWEKGYGLAGDSCGILYVYCKGRPPEEQLLKHQTYAEPNPKPAD